LTEPDIELLLFEHRPGDQPEIFFGDLRYPKAERCAPVGFVFSEGQRLDQRQAGYIVGGLKTNKNRQST